MNHVSYRLFIIAGLIAIIGVGATGCNKSGGSDNAASVPAQPPAAQTAQSMEKVKADPNIPPQVKAQIMNSMQNHGRPAGAPVAPK